MKDRPVMLVDGMNVFMRAYKANPTMNANGEPAGGTVGFINILRSLVRKTMPGKVVIAWEGGGSSRRRALFKEYKQDRRPVKLNRFYEDEIPDSDENKTQQVIVLARLLRNLPVTQVYVSDCEGDDVIAWLATTRFKDDKKVIISSDKDFYQLLDKNTIIYRLGKKMFVTARDVEREYKISICNFALAKAICGDGSDNISGVHRVGYPTLAKRVPELAGNEMTIDKVLALCKERSKKKGAPKAYGSIVDARDLISRNLKLIDLIDNQMVSVRQMSKIDGAVDTCEATFNMMGLMRCLIDEGITNVDVESLKSAFRYLAL